MSELVLLGDEALAQAAIDCGMSNAYGYPGTPSTEIMEYLINNMDKNGNNYYASWCTNEKTAYEDALGVSMVGKRVLVTMKHVGLNVAYDAFINSALLAIKGGLVICVADDPSMHSSQNEQDTRYLSDFAKTALFEPNNQQEVYDMTFEAFELSEKFSIPVVIRLTTRISHSRAAINTKEKRAQNKLEKTENKIGWMLLPSTARKNWENLLTKEKSLIEYSEDSKFNRLKLEKSKLGILTSGLGENYFLENADDFKKTYSHLHIGCYPLPNKLIEKLFDNCDEIYIIEEGYPFIEEKLRGLLNLSDKKIYGKLDFIFPRTGELNPDNVRDGLKIGENKKTEISNFELPNRPPQLCLGCPHIDTYNLINLVKKEYDNFLVTSDIGCYALGAVPPYSAVESIVCMGASVGMAKGASEAGMHPVVATIGDSTFLHSGITSLIDCIHKNVNMTLIIMDNSTVGMTGGQPTMIESARFTPLLTGLGVDPDHLKLIVPLKNNEEKNLDILRKEINYKGLSVILSVRECIETLKRKARQKK